MRILRPYSLGECVFGRRDRCKGPYAALLGSTLLASPLSTRDDSDAAKCTKAGGSVLLRTSLRQLRVPDITALGSTVELRLSASSNFAAREGQMSFPNETEGCARRKRGSWLVQSHLTPGTSVRRVYPRGTRRLVTCHARCHGGPGARSRQRMARTRGMSTQRGGA
jgi:hypothetical protein